MRISDWSSDVCSSDLTASPGPSPSGRARPSVSTMCNEAGREKMAGRTKWMWLAAGEAMVGAAAYAAQGGFGGGDGGAERPMVQLPPEAHVEEGTTSVVLAAACPTLIAHGVGHSLNYSL